MRFNRISSLVLTLLLSCGIAPGQVETTTSITGTVADQMGAVMAGAVVKLTNENTGAARETVTNAEGVYSLCAGINRHDVENERVLRERSSDPS